MDTDSLADAIQSIGFECTRCGACCKGYDPADTGGEQANDGAGGEERRDDAGGEERRDDTRREDSASSDADCHDDREPHTATVFPDEVRDLRAATDYDWRDVARPMPYGLQEVDGEQTGETFEWALQTDACGDCTFYRESDDGTGACAVHEDRPLICETYPFSVALGGTAQPMGEAVDEAGQVRAHECEGLGRDISRENAEQLAAALKERAVREIEEAIAVRDGYRPVETEAGEVVVHDSEGAKRPDGSAL
nr:YkgJ family cysteine cluster protein [Salinirubrum litoreum]